MSSVFWNDLARNLEDPEFLKEYITESLRISTIDAIINALDDARKLENLSKSDLARAIGAEPATVRRLLSAQAPNPTLGTIIEVAAALGLKIKVEPMPDDEREAITRSLREGHPTEAFRQSILSSQVPVSA